MNEAQGVLRGVPVTLEELAAQDAATEMLRREMRALRSGNTHKSRKARKPQNPRKRRGQW